MGDPRRSLNTLETLCCHPHPEVSFQVLPLLAERGHQQHHASQLFRTVALTSRRDYDSYAKNDLEEGMTWTR